MRAPPCPRPPALKLEHTCTHRRAHTHTHMRAHTLTHAQAHSVNTPRWISLSTALSTLAWGLWRSHQRGKGDGNCVDGTFPSDPSPCFLPSWVSPGEATDFYSGFLSQGHCSPRRSGTHRAFPILELPLWAWAV